MPELGTRIVPPLLRCSARIYGVVISNTPLGVCTSAKARHASLSATLTTHTFILPYFCSLALPAFCLPPPCPVACHTLATGCVAALAAFWATPCWERDTQHARQPGDIVQITWRAVRANSAQGTARNHAFMSLGAPCLRSRHTRALALRFGGHAVPLACRVSCRRSHPSPHARAAPASPPDGSPHAPPSGAQSRRACSAACW